MKFRKKKTVSEIPSYGEDVPVRDGVGTENAETSGTLEECGLSGSSESAACPEDTGQTENPDSIVKPSEESLIDRWHNRQQPDVSALAMLREAAGGGSEEAGRIARSLERIDGFRDGGGYKEEDIDAILGLLLDIVAEGCRGAIDVGNIELLLKGAGYEEAVVKARAEGEIAGRNAVIEERLQQSAATDGVPRLGGSSAPADSRRPDTIFDLASFAR